jgi:pimeloyl-ACP methyl ester carboxylesterase
MPFAPGNLHYAERGERRPGASSALLVHGAGASSAIWMMVMARLARASHVVAIDLPGHGASPNEGDAPVSLERYRDAAGALAGTLGPRPSVLVGHSMGALVAIEAALAWPDKVRGLVLCAAAPRLPVRDDLLALIRENHAGFPAWMAEHGLSPQAKAGLRRGFAAAGSATSREVTLADFEVVRAADLRERVKNLTCPVLWSTARTTRSWGRWASGRGRCGGSRAWGTWCRSRRRERSRRGSRRWWRSRNRTTDEGAPMCVRVAPDASDIWRRAALSSCASSSESLLPMRREGAAPCPSSLDMLSPPFARWASARSSRLASSRERMSGCAQMPGRARTRPRG